MSDVPMSFVPAAPDLVPVNGEHRADPPPPPTFDAPTLQRAPVSSAPETSPPVPRPSLAGLPTDPETGDRYRPFILGDVTVRCASEIPADIMLEVVATQQRLSGKEMDELTQAEQFEMLTLLKDMLEGVVWDEDFPLLRERLRNKRRPVSLSELSVAIQALWSEYNEATGVGKEQ